jgi:primosomal replication protein N''
MLTQDLINKIRDQIDTLYQHTQSIDKRNGEIRSARFKYRDFFNPRLFRCESTSLVDYVREADDNFTHLLKLKDHDKAMLAALGEQVTDQISALTQVIRSNEVSIKEHFYQQSSNKKRYSKYKKVANVVMASSHELHQELAQNHEFERRLNEMIFERQNQMQRANAQQAEKLSQEVLTLHQRLGRCRKAISMVEERIQMADGKS